MVKVENQMCVLYRKYAPQVKVTVSDSKMWLFNNDDLADMDDPRVRFLLKDFSFSGIMFYNISDMVDTYFVVENCRLTYTIYKGFIYILDRLLNGALTVFEPNSGYWVGQTFNPVYIEQTEEINECDFLEINKRL